MTGDPSSLLGLLSSKYRIFWRRKHAHILTLIFHEDDGGIDPYQNCLHRDAHVQPRAFLTSVAEMW
jgi:hypothetical protein